MIARTIKAKVCVICRSQRLRRITQVTSSLIMIQGHPMDRFGGISVQKTCNRLKFSVKEMLSRAFLINTFYFQGDKKTFWAQKKVT